MISKSQFPRDESVNWQKQFLVLRPVEGLLRPISLAVSTAYGPAYNNPGIRRSDMPHSQVFQYALSGRGEFIADGDTTRIEPGQGFLCCVGDPNICYRYPDDEEAPWRFLYLAFHDFQGIVASINKSLGHIFEVDQDDALLQRLLNHSTIEQRSLEIDAGAGAMLIQSVLSMLVDSAQRPTRQDNASIELVRSAMKAIERNMHTPYNAAMLAQDLNVSQEHLCRVFSVELQKTPYQCICAAKMSRACDLLRGTKMTIREIAIHMGYEPGSHFARLFKRVIGRPPSEHRKHGSTPIDPFAY